MNKLLIITYYWPPCGGIGVLRCLKYAKYLSKLGWEITVFTVKNGQYPYIDSSNDKDIPENIKVIRSKIWEPYNLYKIISGKKITENVNNVFSTSNSKRGFIYNFSVWVRSNFFIPDARAKWVKPSVKFLTKYLKENPVDIILSNGPPHSNTRIACLLKKETGIPWHADFQDPWSQVDYFAQLKLTKSGLRKHLAMEQETFKYADSISIVSPSWKKDLESIGAKNVEVIEWGFDIDDYKHLKRLADTKFTISHIGILGFDRNPKVLFQVIKDLCNKNKEFEQLIELKIIGEIDLSVKQEIQKYQLEKQVNFVGSLSRSEALQSAINSQVLLLLLNQQPNAKGRIPGKLFEYLAVKRPIIVLGPGECDSGDIVEDTKSGVNLEYGNYEGIKSTLLNLFKKYQSNSNEIDQKGLDRYTNLALTKRLNDDCFLKLLKSECKKKDNL